MQYHSLRCGVGVSHSLLARHLKACQSAGAFVQHLRQGRQQTRCQADGRARGPSWAARLPTWNPSTRKQLNHLMDLFTIADQDGNGILDRREIQHLLQSDGRCTSGICLIAQRHWLTDSDLDDIMALYDVDHKGGLSFNQFMELVLDGVLLDGSMDEYRAVFSAADEDGDGHLDVIELTEVLQQLGRPVTQDQVQQIMSAADLDGNQLIDFNEFFRLFRGQLMDLPKLLRYMKMKPVVLGDEAPPAAAMQRSISSGSVTLVSSEQQLTAVLEALPPQTLLVAMFGLSGDAVCQATAEAVKDLAAVYHKAVFVSIHIDTCPEAKALFKDTLLGRYVPAFYFFRNRQICHSHADSSAAVLERHLREHLPAYEQPLQPVLQQQHQQLASKLQQRHGEGSMPVATVAAVEGEAERTAVEGYSLADLVYDSL